MRKLRVALNTSLVDHLTIGSEEGRGRGWFRSRAEVLWWPVDRLRGVIERGGLAERRVWITVAGYVVVGLGVTIVAWLVWTATDELLAGRIVWSSVILSGFGVVAWNLSVARSRHRDLERHQGRILMLRPFAHDRLNRIERRLEPVVEVWPMVTLGRRSELLSARAVPRV